MALVIEEEQGLGRVNGESEGHVETSQEPNVHKQWL